MKTISLSVILPTLNEAQNLKALVAEIIQVINPAEIIIVDDSSTDGTSDLAFKISANYPAVKTIINRPALGLAQSLQKGIALCHSPYIAWMDADFSHPPEVLKVMLEKIKKADMVVGSWLTEGGRDKRQEKLTTLMSFIINKFCQLLFYKNLTAYTSGYILIKKNVLKNFRLKGEHGEYFIDLIVRKRTEGKKITEVPFTCLSRKMGESKTAPNLTVYLKRGLGYLKMIYALRQYAFKN